MLQTRSCMTLGNFETTQTIHNRDVSVRRRFTVLLLTKLARCNILVDGREAKSFLANEPKTHKKATKNNSVTLHLFQPEK